VPGSGFCGSIGGKLIGGAGFSERYRESGPEEEDTAMHLSVKGLALAMGLAWGGGVLILGLAGAIGWGRGLVDVLGSLYLRFRPTPLGSLIGGAWAFVDGALGGIVVACLYNRFC
jgi:hypothetical protein